MNQEIVKIAIRFIIMYVVFVGILYFIQDQFLWLDGLIFAAIYIALFYLLKILFSKFKRKVDEGKEDLNK
ncbi:hypothetical protein QA612_20005 [Evansella sp. AB-P1]|uniref:hypothetical protein n=1 Tax=Evansella sp. AB-P1 TaxID=3037653 RepID=UPI00241C9FF5|nr:hypothetical protein [Evansella sp. AB-P1]MDG5789746.1 hypothetical protein [Evansella sp. AB-P1]